MTEPLDWRTSVVDYLRANALPQEKFGHQPRLYALTRQLSQGLPADDDILFAAAYLHDLGVFTGHRPEDPGLLADWDMIGYAIRTLPALLRTWGFPEQKVKPVLDCIRTHQPQFTPKTIEATILRDADILEQLGAVGILRTVCKVGRDTRFHTFTDAITSLRRAVDTLPPLLLLPAAHALAAPRIAIHRAWLAAAEHEAGTLLL